MTKAATRSREALNIVDKNPESDDEVIEVNLESFSSIIKSSLDNRRLYYTGDSDCTKRRTRSEISKAAKITGKNLFSNWSIPNPAEESKTPVVRK